MIDVRKIAPGRTKQAPGDKTCHIPATTTQEKAIRFWPSSAAWAIGILLGLNMLFSGIRAQCVDRPSALRATIPWLLTNRTDAPALDPRLSLVLAAQRLLVSPLHVG